MVERNGWDTWDGPYLCWSIQPFPLGNIYGMVGGSREWKLTQRSSDHDV
jgi:hypothetical protein